MALGEEIDDYINNYYSLLIEDSKKRKKLLDKTKIIVENNIEMFGMPSLERLHQTLDEILDRSGQRRLISLDQDLTGEGFTMHNFISSEKDCAPDDTDLKKGRTILQSLKTILQKQEFDSLIEILGGIDNSIFLLSKSNLSLQDILRENGLARHIDWASKLSSESVDLQFKYMQFKGGNKRFNPIQTLNSTSFPIIQNIILDIYGRGQTSFKNVLNNKGFRGLILKEGGVSKIILKTNHELIHKIPLIHKWRKGQESIDIGLEVIENFLYELPGYKKAEKTNNRKEQTRIINDFIKKETGLTEYFYNKGLKGLMKGLKDPTGKMGLKKESSPKELFEFYSKQKKLDWFNRNKENYVQRWRIREASMWKKGEESIQTGIEAIEDVLYELPGYKEAEKSNNRDEQIRIINELIKRETKLEEYFLNKGLDGLMTSLIDPTGEKGLRKERSPIELLKFYSKQKKLDWFNRNKKNYLREWKINENGKWKKGEESVRVGIEAIEDVLYELPGYKEAEKSNNRDEQIRIINELIKKEKNLSGFFYKRLSGLVTNLIDPTGKMGLKKSASPKALLEFYSGKKGLNWFDQNQLQSIKLKYNKKYKSSNYLKS